MAIAMLAPTAAVSVFAPAEVEAEGSGRLKSIPA